MNEDYSTFHRTYQFFLVASKNKPRWQKSEERRQKLFSFLKIKNWETIWFLVKIVQNLPINNLIKRSKDEWFRNLMRKALSFLYIFHEFSQNQKFFSLIFSKVFISQWKYTSGCIIIKYWFKPCFLQECMFVFFFAFVDQPISVKIEGTKMLNTNWWSKQKTWNIHRYMHPYGKPCFSVRKLAIFSISFC